MDDGTGMDSEDAEQKLTQLLDQHLTDFGDLDKLLNDIRMVTHGSHVHQANNLAGQMYASVAAHTGIVTAADHLSQLAMGHGTKEFAFRSFAPFTLIRAALLSAAQTVWVLSGSVQDSAANALIIAMDEAKHDLNHREYLTSSSYAVETLGAEYVAEVASTHHDLVDNKAALTKTYNELTGEPKIPRLKTTDMIEFAAAELRRVSGEDGPALEIGLLYDWRTASAANHARTWVLANRTEGSPESGMFVETTVRELAPALRRTTLLLELASALWQDRRRTANP